MARPEFSLFMKRDSPSDLRAGLPRAGKTLPYGGQKTCPVTGEELGSHGAAISVAVQGQTVYVCCESCVNAVRRNPGLYLLKEEVERQAAGE